MIAIIALAVIFVFFCVMAFMSSKNWLLRHVFLMFGVFTVSIVFLIFAALTLRTHEAWKSEHKRLTDNLARTETDIERLSRPVVSSDDSQSVPQLQSELSRVLLERGRLWRGVRFVGIDEDEALVSVDLTAWGNSGCLPLEDQDNLQPIDGEGEAAPVIANPQIVTAMVVHLFVDTPTSELDPAVKSILHESPEEAEEEVQPRGACTVPSIYIGQFTIADVADALVKLDPTRALDERRLAALEQSKALTIYESLPNDDHAIYEGLSDEQIQALLGSVTAGIPAERVSAVIQEFLRDGTNSESDDPQERVWDKVKFLQAYTVQVDAEDSDDQDRVFDSRGRAIPKYLQLGVETQFAEGDVVEFDSATADRLVQEGVAQAVNEPSRYRRSLRNYEYIFRQDADAIADVEEAIRQGETETEKLTASIDRVNQQIAYRENEKTKLDEDLGQFEAEQNVIRNYRQQLESQRQKQLQELSRLYEYNRQLRMSL